jgi:hypothetical protein
MGRKRSDNPKVPLTLSVRKTTKDKIRAQHFDAASLLDSMFKGDEVT